MLGKHEYLVAQKDELSCWFWQDTKCVMVLPNFHTLSDMCTVNSRSGNAMLQPVEVPKMLIDFQKHMKGVDLSDQTISYHIINHRSRKWWRLLYFHLMMGSALNSYIIAKDPETVRRDLSNFLDLVKDLVDGLIGDFIAARMLQSWTLPNRLKCTQSRLFEKEKVCVECRSILSLL